MTVLFGTGHRPEDAQHTLKEMQVMAADYLWAGEFSAVVVGMAAGFDLALGLAAIRENIPVWSVRPWAGHKPRTEDEDIYREVEDRSERRYIVNHQIEYPGPWVYHERNEFMVDLSEVGVAYWTGKTKGGTYACLKYALKKNKPVHNLYSGSAVSM